jgi:hypothetical protein
MNENNGRFKKGEHRSPETEFKKGKHWRKEKLYWNKEWLEKEYQIKSSGDISKECGVTDTAIIFWLKKLGIKRRSISETRKIKQWGCSGEDNPMFGRKGELNVNWKGGCTPERQEFYLSKEWKEACASVYKRDSAKCQRCGCSGKMNIHHIVSFSVREYRADINNLVLLCVKCHRFVHSKKNTNQEFIKKGGVG